MSHWLTLSWENDRLLLLSAKMQNGSMVVERIQILSVSGSEDEEDSKSAVSLKEQLSAILHQQRWTKAETIVVLSRSDVELRSMVFPPVPVEELPDMVRFQASKEFNGYDPQAPLDFMITNKLENVSRSTLFPVIHDSDLKQPTRKEQKSRSNSPKHLLASTIRLTTFRNIQKFCDELNLVLRRVVLRPCEAAALWRHHSETDSMRTTLFVELDVNETSQTVLYQGEPVFLRSPKISCPGDVSHPDFAARLVAELKRTRIAVRNEIQGVTVDEVVLCGIGERFDSLARQVAEGMGIPVKTFDPWNEIQTTDDLKGNLPNPERFASLIGATQRGIKGESADIDFCSPKKRPEPVGHRNLMTGIAVALFLGFLCLVGYGFYSRSALSKEVKSLAIQKLSLQKTAKGVSEQRTQLTAINTWLVDNVNWFEQIGWLSRKIPDAREMILNELNLSANNGGSMSLKAFVKDSSVVSPMEERLRDENHLVKTGEKGEFQGLPNYGFRFNLSVFLSKESAASQSEEGKPEESKPTEAVHDEKSNPKEDTSVKPDAPPPIPPGSPENQPPKSAETDGKEVKS